MTSWTTRKSPNDRICGGGDCIEKDSLVSLDQHVCFFIFCKNLKQLKDLLALTHLILMEGGSKNGYNLFFPLLMALC